mgnify:CR=1 FL=1
MDIEDVERVTVVGAGEMGRGIAAVSALSGYETTLQDVDPDQLAAAEEHAAWSFDKQVEHGAATEAEADAALERFETTESLEDAVANARTNAAMNGMDNCTFVSGNLKELFSIIVKTARHP